MPLLARPSTQVVGIVLMLQSLLAYRLDAVVFATLCFGGIFATHVWLRRTGRATGAPRVAWLALALVVASGAALAEYGGEREQAILSGQMEAFARTYAAELERMGHARIKWDTAADDPLYLSMIGEEKGWLGINAGVNDIYTFRANGDGAIAFVVDSETDYDRNGRYEGDREGRTAIGEVFPEGQEPMRRALRGEPVFDGEPVTDRWGTWVSAYVPLRDPADPSKVEAALGVDYDAAGWTQSILAQRAVFLGGATVLAVIVTAAAASVTALRAEVARRADAERALRREEERFRLAARCATDVIYEWDLRGDDLQWFGGAGGLVGFEAGRLPPTISAWEQTILPEDRGRVMAALERHVARGEPYDLEYRVVLPDGTVRHWLDRGQIVEAAAGRPRSMIGAVSDVTSRARARELETEREGLRKAVASMEQVLGIVGHELRTPLAGVRAMSEFLLTAGAEQMQESQTFLTSIHNEVVRMGGTVNDLLEAARINSGLARWNWAPFRPADVCREAVETVRPLLDGDAVSLSVDVESPAVSESAVTGDAAAVRRLVLNLLDNARKHTTAGHVRVAVRHRRDAEGHAWVDLEVSDTGSGIAADLLGRLGQAFVLNAGLTGDKHVSGAGLGLAICQGVALAHGGYLRVSSVVGTGTTVTASLRGDLEGPAEGHGTAANAALPVYDAAAASPAAA